MADTKISGLSALAAADVASADDVVAIVDTSATTTKKATVDAILYPHTNDSSAAHAASAISVADSAGVITGADVEAAIAEAMKGQFAVNTVATSGSTETLTLAPFHKVTMDQNCTFTFPTPTTAGHAFLLHLLGAFTPTFPASVDWNAGSAPTYADDSLYQFATDDTGTTWYGSLISSALA